MSAEPRFVTIAELEALEGRLINRMTEMELRLVRDIHRELRDLQRWTIGLILPIYALVLATILTVAISAVNIIDRLPAKP